MTTSTSMTETRETARHMAEVLLGVAVQLDSEHTFPTHMSITRGKRISAQVRGADLDAVADLFDAGDHRRYGADNIERVGTFGAYKVEIYGSASEYDAAHKDTCYACGQPVTS